MIFVTTYYPISLVNFVRINILKFCQKFVNIFIFISKI